MRLYSTITKKLSEICSYFERRFKQGEEEKIKYKRVSLSIIEELDIETIKYLLSEGNRYIDNQNQTGKEIRTKSLALLGILSTILISLIGFCILLIHENHCSSALFFFVLYGIMATGIVSFRLFVGVVYERSYKISGEKPTYILHEKAYDYAREKKDLHKYLLGQQLNPLSEKIEYNKIRNKKLQESFKSNMNLACLFICIAFVLFLIYWISA